MVLGQTALQTASSRNRQKTCLILSAGSTVASAPAKRINVDDAMATYLSTVAATWAHKTWLAYNLILNEFRKTCTKEYLDQIDKSDLTAFVVALKKAGQDDRTVANRLAGVVTFLRTHGIANVTPRHKYTEKKVRHTPSKNCVLSMPLRRTKSCRFGNSFLAQDFGGTKSLMPATPTLTSK